MIYPVLIIVAVALIYWFSKKTFYWETVVKNLWKQVYFEADSFAYRLKESNNELDKTELEFFKQQIDVNGNLINHILDYINYLKKKQNHDERIYVTEEETFGYGRYDFNTVLMLAKSNPGHFKKFK